MNWKEILKVSVPTSVVLFVLWVVSEYSVPLSGDYIREALHNTLLSAPLITVILLGKKQTKEILIGVVVSFVTTLLLWAPFALFGF